jgi:putative DNA primase/helicase
VIWQRGVASPLVAERFDPGAGKRREGILSNLPERFRSEASQLLDLLAIDCASPPAAAAKSEEQGRAIELHDPEPWPDPVDGAALLEEIVATLQRFVVLPRAADAAIALWVLHSHLSEVASISPILALVSPEKRCGKTTALTILSALVPRALQASNVSAAALFRTVEKFKPTLLVDEADTFLAEREELRGLLNSGHFRAGARVIRIEGEAREPRIFSTWGPKAIALIGELPTTLHDRAIVVPLRRRARHEHVQQLRLDRLSELEPLRQRIARWAVDHAESLPVADPVLPESLHDRAADNWRGLIAIADLIGDGWSDRGREAAILLSNLADAVDNSAAVQLLADLREIFREANGERLRSARVATALAAKEDRPWAEWRKGQPITARQVAALLQRFGIRPQKIRIGAETCQGYLRDQFDDAFARYLPSDPEHPEQAANDGAPEPVRDLEQLALFPDRGSHEDPHQSRSVPDVPVRRPEAKGWLPKLGPPVEGGDFAIWAEPQRAASELGPSSESVGRPSETRCRPDAGALEQENPR